MLFQMMFAIITPALITGAFAERKKFSAFLLFTVLWATFVYDPLAHWVWGDGGWLKKLGALDFAGGTVVHITSGVSALVCAIMLGKRKGYGHQPMQPHNLPMTVMGAGAAVVRLVRLQRRQRARGQRRSRPARSWPPTPAAAAAALGWMFTEWMARGKPTVLGAASGAVAGLVAITPAAGFVRPVVVDRHRRRGRRPLLRAPATSSRSSATTTRSTCSACTASAGPGARSPPASSPPRRSTRRAATACSTATRASSGRRSSRWRRPTRWPSSAPSSS